MHSYARTYAIPHFCFGIKNSIGVVGNEFDAVLEANLRRNSSKQINTESLEHVIASEIALLYHHIRLFFTSHYGKLFVVCVREKVKC